MHNYRPIDLKIIEQEYPCSTHPWPSLQQTGPYPKLAARTAKPNERRGTVVLSRVMRKIVCRQLKEALLCNGGIAESGLQMPHVHILLVTPLGAWIDNVQ